MPNLQPEGPNAQQIEYWNEQAGAGWVAAQESLDRQIGGLGQRGIALAAPKRGEHVLDVGCGCGDTTLQLADAVGPEGRVVGLDISTPMLNRARERAADRSHVEFINADAQTHALEPNAFDLVFSRFGVMFFAEPEAAFRNLFGALKPGGRLRFVCWQALQQNAWMRVPIETVAKHVTLPPPGDPHAPGPMAFADPERVSRMFENAGFIDVEAPGLEDTLLLGGGGPLERTAQFMLQMGPAARAVRESGLDADALAPIERALAEVLADYAGDDGVRMGCAVWLFGARRPA